MKKTLLSVLTLVMIGVPVHVFAEKTNEPVEPNRYEKRKINIQNNFRDNLIQRNELPEEQKALTFEKPVRTESNVIMAQLFQSFDTIETNTITTKSDQLGLFSQEESKSRLQTDPEEDESGGSKVTFLLWIAVIVVISAMFFLIIPRLNQSNAS